MIQGYVTLNEAAELEGVKYDAFQKSIVRNRDKYEIKTVANSNGGRAVVLVAVSSLSKSARNAWREREKLRLLAEEKADPEADHPPDIRSEAPWYVGTDVEWYMSTYKENYYKGIELREIIQKFLQYDDRGRTQYADQFAQEHLGKNRRTLYRYLESYNEALAWADRLGRKDGCDYSFFTVLALCRKPKQTGLFPAFTPEVKQAIQNIWFHKDFAKNNSTREMLYEKLQLLAEMNKWDYIPSYQSVTRYINYLMTEAGMENAHYLAARGAKEYKNRKVVKASRDAGNLKVMEVVMGDEHTFDCWVSYTMPNGRVKAIRPVLVAWVDVRSRTIMGDVMCEHANTQILKESVLKMVYQEHGGVPKYLYIDNGKDYTSFEMTGRNRKERHGNELAFEEDVRGFYKSIGVIDDHRAKPYEAWNKGEVERFFGTVCNKFSKWMTSYTGTLTGSRTDGKVTKDIQKMLEAGKLLTIEEFYQKWNEWLHTKYEQSVHSGLRKQGEPHPTPWRVYEEAERYEKALPPKSYATLLMMKEENVLVRNIGIVRNGYEYRADELCDYIGQKVNIRYDPEDVSVLYVFDRKGKKICEAYSQELLAFGAVNENTIRHIAMQKRQMERDRQRLEEARRPFEEINEQYVGFDPVTGGVDLMIGGGKKKAKRSNMVAFPESRMYQENADLRRKRQEEEDADDTYLARSAEAALKKLRAMEG